MLEPNKYNFLAVLFFVPIFICFLGFPLVAGLSFLVVNYSTVIGLGFVFLAYSTVCDAENTYQTKKIKGVLLKSLFPLRLPEGIRGVHKVFRNKFNLNE